jgi:16S rRNA (adenine1518-N6/adenine1519-N6)-dimethyltransferase
MRRKGQHFLVDDYVLQRIADYAELGPDDRVLEIGPGTGNLTSILSRRAGRVYAVEVDRDLASGLVGRFKNVEIISGDALKVELPDYNKIVSNLPYQISSKITYRLLARPFHLAVLMYQKEFAKKMAAAAGGKDYGRLSAVVGHYARTEILEYVSRTAFRPNPHVESAIVRLRPRQVLADVDYHSFMRFVTGLFNHRRKLLRSALGAMGVSRESLAGIDGSILDRRAEELLPDEVAQLSRELRF